MPGCVFWHPVDYQATDRFVETPAYRPRTIWAWALYDFANSAFTTLVVTFVYAAYFTQAVAPDPISGTTLWSRAVTASGVLVALLSPYLGALADQGWA